MKTNFNILFSSDVSISDVIGGAERVLYEQSTGLARRGHNVHILTRRLPFHRDNHEIINGVKEWRYEINQEKNPLLLMRQVCKNGKRLYDKLQRKNDFDCLNFHQPFTSYAVVKSSLCDKIRKIYTCHSLAFEEYLSRSKKTTGFLKYIINFMNVFGRRKIEKYVLENSDKIVVLSNYTRDKLKTNYSINEKKINIIPGGVDLKKFCPSSNKNIERNKLNISNNKVILFTVRNLVQRMGIENLIVALKLILDETDEVHLIIGGEGPLKNKLMALSDGLGISDHITFTGFIPERLLPSYYRLADIFILPTKELEGFGMVSLEAMASGLPVLGTPIGGTVEVLKNFDSDFIFPNTEPAGMSDLILEKYHLLKNNPQKWQEISCKARSYVEQNYSWDNNINLLEKLL